MSKYVHGYTPQEGDRLEDQANALNELLHEGTVYKAGSEILEAGCGVGAQTVILARNNPRARITSMDISPESIERAKSKTQEMNITNVTFQVGDIFHLPFAEESFDHVFVCFVLEHLRKPLDALKNLKRVLKTGGTITVIEGDHGSAYFHPHSVEAQEVIDCLIKIQADMGGNSLIGRQIYPLLRKADFKDIRVSPCVVYADASYPEMVEGFTRNTFTAMVEGVREEVLKRKMMGESRWNKGISDLYRTAEGDGTFSYTFFKGVAFK